jgi:hypothetical protein
MKPKVVIVGIADWAGSGYQACCATNSVGEFDCRHITTYDHLYEYPRDVLVKIYPRMKEDSYHEKILCDSAHSTGYADAVEILRGADIIHLWNSFPGEQCMSDNGLPIDWQKVRVVTMTGTMYRKHHAAVNTIISHWPKIRLTVQDALFHFPNEVDATYIPHAVNLDLFTPSEERDKTIGTYQTAYKANERTSDWDISKLQDILRSHPDWKIDLNYKMPWKERLEKLARCMLFVQDISPHIGVWGRSTLEACALEVPTLQNYSMEVPVLGGDKLGNIPLVRVDENTIAGEIKKLIEDEGYCRELGRKSRQWVKDHFAYSIIGKMYSDVYREVLSEI